MAGEQQSSSPSTMTTPMDNDAVSSQVDLVSDIDDSDVLMKPICDKAKITKKKPKRNKPKELLDAEAAVREHRVSARLKTI